MKSPVQRMRVHLNTWRGGVTVVVIAQNTLQGSSNFAIQHITKLRSLPIYSDLLKCIHNWGYLEGIAWQSCYQGLCTLPME